jgi:hypothetical protein
MITSNSSCTQNLKVALGYAFKNPQEHLKPVLFVFSIQNYYGFNGIRLNNEAYTSYPGEREILMRDGLIVYVMEVQPDIMIRNENEGF